MVGKSTPKAQSGVIGAKLQYNFKTITTPGVEQELLLVTVPIGKKHELFSCIVTSEANGIFTIVKVGEAEPVGSGGTGPMDKKDMYWNPTKDIQSGESYKVMFYTYEDEPETNIYGHLGIAEADV